MEILCFFSVTLALTANTQLLIATGGDLLEAFARTGYTILTNNCYCFFFNCKKMFFMPWTPQKHKFHPNTAPPCIPWIRGQKDDDETFSHGRDPDCPVELVWVAVEKLCDAPDRPLYNRLTARHNADARVFCNAFIWATVFCTSEQSNDKTSTINLQNLTSALKCRLVTEATAQNHNTTGPADQKEIKRRLS